MAFKTNRAIVGDVAVHDVPCGLVVGADINLAAREHGGGDVLLVAVGIDVADGFSCLRSRRSAGHDERERHRRPHEVVFD